MGKTGADDDHARNHHYESERSQRRRLEARRTEPALRVGGPAPLAVPTAAIVATAIIAAVIVVVRLVRPRLRRRGLVIVVTGVRPGGLGKSAIAELTALM